MTDKVHEMISTFSYEIPPAFHDLTMIPISEEEAKKTFQEYDDIVQIDKNADNSPLIAIKFFNDYCLLAQAKPNLIDKSITIMDVKKIPTNFINTLPDKEFVTLVGWFYEQIAEQFIWREKIKDSTDPKRVICRIAMFSVIYNQKYINFVEKYS